MAERKISALESLIGTERMNEGEVESFANEMQQVRDVLTAASVLLVYYGQPNNRFCSDNETLKLSDLSAVMGELVADHVEVLARLERKGAKLAMPLSVVVPPAKGKFGTARKVVAQKGAGQ